jgi:hypothetical protein
MSVEYSRPLLWAIGTDFDARYENANELGIELDISTEEDKEEYQSLVEWMVKNVAHQSSTLKAEDAVSKWKRVLS